MPLPLSFATDGFVSPDKARKRLKLKNGRMLKPLLIGTEGGTDTGKSEFIFSCPGPGLAVCVDRGMDPLFDNPSPPPSRRSDFGVQYIEVPLNLTKTQAEYGEYYVRCRDTFYKALNNPDALTVAMDGDSDFYELQVLAEFGKTTQIWPQTRYGDVYARRRAIVARAHDSGKIVIFTNKLRDEYAPVLVNGKPKLDDKSGEVVREKTGGQERQGFKDQDYLVNLQIRHLFKPAGINAITKKATPKQWGIRILKCKANTDLVGAELWGPECKFASLVQLVYPNTPKEEWGL